ncbi:DUF423 domain-containing protein [Ferrimonas marina]|uniref:Uncharacterized membrane protein YgdD, TMEM256/DUF423 family n=1 Tax=Ferrimonas marina TaxID=299255 RepID=A0A1M5SBV3_9GAMM|nr:DUF423 domain-containing protein [Ferrimonas marina]SHH35959.1 Uncharacterized membrane protein YgdD, TMEM256/DUF423 family [Ferrimonas marina]
MARLYAMIAAASALLATILGAYGAHGLPGRVSASLLESFQTAVQYQFFHALALFGVALALRGRGGERWLQGAGACFIVGSLGFSGSIYALVLVGNKFFGPITPMGGMTLMIGWALLMVGAWRWESVNE